MTKQYHNRYTKIIVSGKSIKVGKLWLSVSEITYYLYKGEKQTPSH